MARVHRLIPDIDYKKLPLNPVEGSVFLKIDGKLTDEEIAKATGFHAETVQKAMDRLVELGAVALVDKAKDQAERTVKAAANLALGGNLGKSPYYEAKALAEEIELDVERRKIILDAAERIEKLNFYELLGLHRLVDKKEVKAAYYAVAPEFHPDKFFQRKLGSFKSKIEAVFARLTLAHDTLSSPQRRAEYDDYLSTLEKGKRAEGLLEGSQASILAAQAQIEAEAKRAADAASQVQKAQDLSDRKRALAAKLGGGRLGGIKPEKDPTVAPMDPRQAAEALRVRYEYAKEQAARAQLENALSKGRMAMVQGDWAGAANLFRIAATLAPSNPDVQREAGEVLGQAAIHLADTFHKLGEFELQQERWSEAAGNLLKACAGRPEDARLHERAAFATFKEGSNPKRAAELARRAVELSPKTPQFRVTLAYAYAAGGLGTSAKAEIDRALEIAPKNEAVVELVKAAREIVAGLLSRAGKPKEEPLPANTPAQGLPAFLPASASHASPPPAPPSQPGQPVPHGASAFHAGQAQQMQAQQMQAQQMQAQQMQAQQMQEMQAQQMQAQQMQAQQMQAQQMQAQQMQAQQMQAQQMQAQQMQYAQQQYAQQLQQHAQQQYAQQQQQHAGQHPGYAAPVSPYPAQQPQPYAAPAPSHQSSPAFPAQRPSSPSFPAQSPSSPNFPAQSHPSSPGFPQQPMFADAQSIQRPSPTFGPTPTPTSPPVPPQGQGQPSGPPAGRPSGAYSVVTETRKKG